MSVLGTELLCLDKKSKHTQSQSSKCPACRCLAMFLNRPNLGVLYGFLRLKSREKPLKISPLAYFQSFCRYLRILSDIFRLLAGKICQLKDMLEFLQSEVA